MRTTEGATPRSKILSSFIKYWSCVYEILNIAHEATLKRIIYSAIGCRPVSLLVLQHSVLTIIGKKTRIVNSCIYPEHPVPKQQAWKLSNRQWGKSQCAKSEQATHVTGQAANNLHTKSARSQCPKGQPKLP